MRGQIHIVQIRVSDIQIGDVVNKRGPDKVGWIEVARVETVPSGDIVVHDENESDSFSAAHYDLVWLQTLAPLTYNSHLVIG